MSSANKMEKNSAIIIERIYERSLPFDELSVKPESIENKMGYHQGGAPGPFPSQIRKCLLEAPALAEIRGGYCIFNTVSLSLGDNKLTISDISFHVGKIIGKQLKGLEAIAVFVCTIGPKMSNLAKKLMAEGDLIQAYVLDTIGSETVERAMDRVQEELAASVKAQHENITNRFSPGYCGWDVSAQHALFSLLPKRFCGVTLTEAALMLPLKSLSGIIAIGKNVARLEYPCKICDVKDCLRRNGESPV
jgi:hypothetical protein